MRQHDVDPVGAVTVEGRMGLRLDLKRMPFADKGVFKVGQQHGGTVIVVLLEKTEFFSHFIVLWYITPTFVQQI